MKQSITTLLCALFPGIFLCVGAPDEAKENTNDLSLVFSQKGDLPIILSAPHGGRSAVPGLAPRTGEGIARFVPRADSWTDPLTQKLADEIEKRTGKRPYVVIAKFHRKYLDVNRPRQLAYESEVAQPIYDAYHTALVRARREVFARWRRGLIIDVHGQATEPNTIIRGTQNGETSTHLIEKFGRDSLTGETSLFGLLSGQGVQIHPAVNSPKKEHPKYNGGYIVKTYGSAKGGTTIDAIQVEVGRNLRRPEVAADTAKKLAVAIVGFANKYLPAD